MNASPEQLPHSEPVRIAELVLGMVKPLVDHPDQLRLETETGEHGTTLRLYVVAGYLGKVIGKQGRTARSIRTILSAIGSKAGHRYALDVLDEV